MTRIFLAALAIIVTSGTAFAGSYWVVGNRTTSRCDIVTSNPVINVDGDYYFGTGPYNSKDDAKLAMSTISVCPPYRDKSPSNSNAKMLR